MEKSPPSSSSSSSAQFKSQILSLEDIQLANSLRETDPNVFSAPCDGIVPQYSALIDDSNDVNGDANDMHAIEERIEIEEDEEVGVASYDSSQSYHEMIPYNTLETDITTTTTTAAKQYLNESSNNSKLMSIQVTQNDLKCIQSFIKNSGSLQVTIIVFFYLFV